MKRNEIYKKKKGTVLMAAVLLMLLCQSYGCATLSTATGPNASATKPQVEMALTDAASPRYLARNESDTVIHKPKTPYQTYFTEPPGKRPSEAVTVKADSHPAEAHGRTGLTNGEFLAIISPAVFAPYIMGPATGIVIGIADVAGLVHTAAMDLRDGVKSRRAYRTTQQTAFTRSVPEKKTMNTAMAGSTVLK